MISKRKMLYEALANEHHRYFHGAPTRQQAKQIFWNDLKKDTKLFRTLPANETELYVTLMNGTEIHVVGLDKPERIEGQVWHGCHITEFPNAKGSAWPENIEPALMDTNGFGWLEGVPEGRDHFYEMALLVCDGALPVTRPIEGSFHECQKYKDRAYYHWFSSDVLPAEKIQEKRETLDEKTFRQEYEGSFEGFQGLAYYTFGAHNVDNSIQYDSNLPVCVGMDFNVNPMTAALGHIKHNTYHQFGEIYLNNSNTYDMRDELLRMYKNPKSVIIFPDSTGKAEKSNATRSDLEILWQAGFEVRAKNKNPFVKDRVNAMNSLLKSQNGSTRYKLNAENCKHTLRDFHQVERSDDGKLDKDQETSGLKHITDALGYLVEYNWPVRDSSALTVAA